MGYIQLEEIKKHLNIDSAFEDDDNYLLALENVAEDVVAKTIDNDLHNLEDENHHLPAAITHAMLLFIGTQYAFRESVTSASSNPLPHSFDLLADLYHNYNNTKVCLQGY